MRLRCWLLVLSSCLVFAATSYQSGKLVSVTDTSSNRVIGENGSTQTITDVEYRLSVQIGKMTYVGSYWPRWKWSYAPTDFIVNDPVEVRIAGKFMYMKRGTQGKELKTTIVQRIRKAEN